MLLSLALGRVGRQLSFYGLSDEAARGYNVTQQGYPDIIANKPSFSRRGRLGGKLQHIDEPERRDGHRMAVSTAPMLQPRRLHGFAEVCIQRRIATLLEEWLPMLKSKVLQSDVFRLPDGEKGRRRRHLAESTSWVRPELY